MREKEWKIPYGKPEIPSELIRAGYGPLLSAVLALRGVRTAAQARALLDAGEEALHDPLLLTDMAAGRERLLRAIGEKETVGVFGDYDVDGITSTCLLTDYLRSKGLTVRPHIPDRSSEGYGLNSAALDAMRANGVTLVITVDCGITALEEAEHAAALGMDMIITDHHECGPALPKAAAVIDCRREGDAYPNRDLAGVGMAMKLVCACEGDPAPVLEKYADLAAIGTVADVMPLTGENRYLVRRGLEQIARSPRPGVAALLREAGVNPDRLTASTLGFSLAPRLNAAGRLDSPKTAALLLMSTDGREAAALARELCELNRRRQSIETEIWREACSLLPPEGQDTPIVLASENWHQGVIGIAASRLAEQYAVPAVMICLSEGVGKGSCRSGEGFNLYEALSACSEHLMGFGGHALAAGLTIQGDRLEAFRQALADYYRANRPKERPALRCDLLISDPAMLSLESVRSLDLLEPYGSGNPKPLLCLSGVELVSAAEVGNGRHLRVKVRLGGELFEGIFFSHTAGELGLREGARIDLAFVPQINEYRGRESVQLLISAARPHESRDLCRRLLAGDDGCLWAALPYRPYRGDFVRVWRSLGGDFAVAGDAEGVLSQCPQGMEPERFCLCLLAFCQLGLLRSPQGGVFGARPAAIEGKADLEAAPLLRRMSALAAE